MPELQAGPLKGRYIVRSKGALAPIARFIENIEGDPDVSLVDTIGPKGRVHTAVVEVSADKALQFEHRFSHSDELIIERDQPLSLLG
ncbi:MAG: hypothetical protein ACXWVG_17410 [Telluria sp.]